MGWIWTSIAVGMLALGSFGVARRGFRLPAGSPRWLGSVVLGWAWMTLGVEGLGGLGLLGAGPLVGWSAAGLGIAALLRVVRPGPADPPTGRPGPAPGFAATVALGLVLWGAIRLGLYSALFPVKVVSDGPIYHLYLAARWWKAGRLFPVATPFGEVGATYFWANGEAWFAWLMTLMGGDALARLGQVPFLVAAAGAAYAMSRRLGAGASSALIATAWFASVAPLLLYTFEPNVDIIFLAGYLLASYFFLRYSMGDDGAGSLALGALAAGLGMGTKPTGLVFFPPLIALMAAFVGFRGGMTPRRRAGHLALLVALPAVTAGYWPIRNALLTGNPLYPLRVEAFGRTWLAGWFGPEAMTRSPYYLAVGRWGSLADILLAVLDPRMVPLWLAALAGAWAIGRRDREGSGRVWVLSALAVANLALYWLVIPYRTQQRFMLQAMGLASVPLALTIDRSRWLRAAATGLLALHMLTPQVWPIAATEAEVPWDRDAQIPNVMPAATDVPPDLATLRTRLGRPESAAGLRLTLVLGLGAFPVAWLWTRPGRASGPRRWAAAVAATAGLAAAGAACLGGPSRLPVPVFPDYFAAWMELELRSGPGGVRLAYAGIKIPYYLLGGRLQNEVRYINVDAHRDWLMHDYHRAAPGRGLPETWDNPFPGWDRLRPDYRAWLANLRAEAIQILVVARVNPAEGPHNVADREWFPIERAWADAHPEAFEPIYGVDPRDPKIRLYRVLPENPAAGPTDRRPRSH